MNDKDIIKDLECAAEWFTEHGRNTNTAIIGICNRAADLIKRQRAEIEKLTIQKNAFGAGMKVEARKNDDVRAKAIKEFWLELQKTVVINNTHDGYMDFAVDWNCLLEDGNDLVKEMLGKEDEGK